MTKLFSHLIKWYKIGLSPFIGPCCRFYPTCSEYLKASLIKYGVLRGVAYGLWRLVRCQPFSKGGWNPV